MLIAVDMTTTVVVITGHCCIDIPYNADAELLNCSDISFNAERMSQYV